MTPMIQPATMCPLVTESFRFIHLILFITSRYEVLLWQDTNPLQPSVKNDAPQQTVNYATGAPGFCSIFHLPKYGDAHTSCLLL